MSWQFRRFGDDTKLLLLSLRKRLLRRELATASGLFLAPHKNDLLLFMAESSENLIWHGCAAHTKKKKLYHNVLRRFFVPGQQLCAEWLIGLLGSVMRMTSDRVRKTSFWVFQLLHLANVISHIAVLQHRNFRLRHQVSWQMIPYESLKVLDHLRCWYMGILMSGLAWDHYSWLLLVICRWQVLVIVAVSIEYWSCLEPLELLLEAILSVSKELLRRQRTTSAKPIKSILQGKFLKIEFFISTSLSRCKKLRFASYSSWWRQRRGHWTTTDKINSCNLFIQMISA